MAEVIRPTLTFEMLQIGTKGGVLAVRAFKEIFGSQNYDEFRRAGKKGQYIPEMDRQRVDRETTDRFGEMFGVARDKREEFWQNAMKASNATIEYARGILFADQERQATLITGIANGSKRPSAILQRLTKPTSAGIPSEANSRKYRYEQARQLAVGLPCAEKLARSDNGCAEEIFDRINDWLEGQLFIGRRGATRNFHIFSYHEPQINRLAGLSAIYPDARFQGKWVKSLDRPVRTAGIRDEEGNIVEVVPVLYDYREKEIGSAVIKAWRKSLKNAQLQPNGNSRPIETTPHVTDTQSFRLVLMQGDRPLRDRLTAQLESLLWTLDGVSDIVEDDDVNSENGHPHRVQQRRRQVYMQALSDPFEATILTHPDYLSYQYEVGKFNPEKGMHDGTAWDLYKLEMVAEVAEFIWPFRFYGIDLTAAKKRASYEYAARLWRKERIDPSPFDTEY